MGAGGPVLGTCWMGCKLGNYAPIERYARSIAQQRLSLNTGGTSEAMHVPVWVIKRFCSLGIVQCFDQNDHIMFGIYST